jgi:hypothetical protein
MAGPFYDKLKNNPNLMVNAECLTKIADEIDSQFDEVNSQFDDAAPKDTILNDSVESNVLPAAATSTPITTLLQTARDNLKWLFINKVNKSGDTITGVLNVPTPPLPE